MRAEMLGPHNVPDLQGICRRHPWQRPAPAQPDQRDSRSQPHRGGPLRPHEEPVDLADIVEDCRRMVNCAPRRKGIEIVRRSSDNLPEALGRRARHPPGLRSTCSPMPSSSRRWRQRDLKVGAHRRWRAVLSVNDNGPGIPEDEIETRAQLVRPGLAGASRRPNGAPASACPSEGHGAA